MIDARGLHGWLEVGDDFSTWMKRRIREYRFEEGADFSATLRKSTGGRRRKDYLQTVGMAKELSMVERTQKGRDTRRYFIQMEQAALQMAQTPVEQGQPDAIPQSFKDAFTAMESRLVAHIDAGGGR